MAKKEEGPDQARSWVIAMAGCVINSLLSGFSRTTGLFYVALIETYGVSRMEANMPFTMRNVVRNLAGPLVGAIGQRYGGRDVTFVGGIFAALGIGLCFLAPSMTWIIVLWGGIHGIGVALANTLFPVIINQYFLKYRATASGLSLSGACVGSFIFPTVIEYMLRNFGLSGSFLVTGAFIMHVLPAAILMTEPSWTKRKPIRNRKSATTEESRRIKSPPSGPKLDKIAEDSEVPIVNMRKIPSSGVICDNIKKEEDTSEENVRNARVFSRSGADNPAFVGSKTDINEKNAEMVEEEYEEIDPKIRTLSIADSSIIFTGPPRGEIQETSVAKSIAIMMRSPMFYLISISLAGFAMLFDPAIIVIVDYIKDKGLQEDDAKYFIIMMSLGDLLGRLCFGWVTDRNYMTIPKFMLLIQTVQGICFLLLPMFSHFDVLIAIIMIYGLASGATLVLFPILLSKYLASVQSLAIGSISVVTGIISFAIPLLIGYFRDNAGSYDGMFVITGGLSVVAGCLWLFEPLIMRLQKSHHSASVAISS